MISFLKKLAIILVILHSSHAANQSIITYVNDGDNLTFPLARCKYDGSTWEGPCLASRKCKSSITTYFDGLKRYTSLPTNINIETDTDKEDGKYELQIFNISSENEGLFLSSCLYNNKVQNKEYRVVLKEKPSNIIIQNLTSEGTIQGTEDVPLQLICEVKSGLPEDRIALYKGLSLLKVGSAGSVSHSFIPTSQDNGLVVSCVFKSTSLTGSLNKKAVLDIKYRPTVHFIKGNQQIIEGNEFMLQCLSEGNPPVASTHINKGAQILTFCKTPVCSLQRKGLRNESGAYSCTASNEIGIRNSSTTVTVLYPPVVFISLSANKLHCNAVGVPNNATIVSWRHYSHRRTFLRMLEGSEYLTLSSLYPRYMMNGFYICEATNGIPDIHGKTLATGNYSVKMSGLPEVLQRTERVQFGRYNDLTTIQIFVHSVPLLEETKLVKNEAFVEKKGRLIQTYHYIKEHIFGKKVWIEGYTMSLQIPSTYEEDFGNYTFLLTNANGLTRFTAVLKVKDNTDADHNSDEDIGKVFLSKYVIATLVGSSLVSAVVAGICVFFFCPIRKNNSFEIQHNRTVENDPQYEEIYELNESNIAIEIEDTIEERGENDSMNEQINESVEIYLEQRQSDISENPETDEQVGFHPRSVIEDTEFDSLPVHLTETDEIRGIPSDSEDSRVNSENVISSSQINPRASYQSLGERNSHGSHHTGYDELLPVPRTFPICQNESETNNV